MFREQPDGSSRQKHSVPPDPQYVPSESRKAPLPYPNKLITRKSPVERGGPEHDLTDVFGNVAITFESGAAFVFASAEQRSGTGLAEPSATSSAPSNVPTTAYLCRTRMGIKNAGPRRQLHFTGHVERRPVGTLKRHVARRSYETKRPGDADPQIGAGPRSVSLNGWPAK